MKLIHNFEELALELCRLEGGEEEVNIAQTRSLLSHLTDLLYRQPHLFKVLLKNGQQRADGKLDYVPQPLADRVIILPDPVKEVTAGGIIIPEVAKEKDFFGTLIAKGPKVQGVAVGDRVLYSIWSGQDVEVIIQGEDRTAQCMRVGDIKGVEFPDELKIRE